MTGRGPRDRSALAELEDLLKAYRRFRAYSDCGHAFMLGASGWQITCRFETEFERGAHFAFRAWLSQCATSAAALADLQDPHISIESRELPRADVWAFGKRRKKLADLSDALSAFTGVTAGASALIPSLLLGTAEGSEWLRTLLDAGTVLQTADVPNRIAISSPGDPWRSVPYGMAVMTRSPSLLRQLDFTCPDALRQRLVYEVARTSD